MKRKTSQDYKKKTKQLLKKIGRRNRMFVNMKCKKCAGEYQIRINSKENKQVYEKIKENWKCLLCK